MANQLRYRYGQVALMRLRVHPDSKIDAGDIVWLDRESSVCRPASEFETTQDKDETHREFARVFLGIAHQRSGIGETDPISVDLSPHACYEFDCTVATFEVGDVLAPEWMTAHLMNQQVCHARFGIARCAEFVTFNRNKVRVQFASAFHTASANRNAQMG